MALCIVPIPSMILSSLPHDPHPPTSSPSPPYPPLQHISFPFLSIPHTNSSLLLPDLTPNVGLWWYFFIEMFDSFRSFFLCVFQLHLLIYVAPLCIRLKRNPLAICTTLLGIISIFKSYPSVADLGLYLGMLSLHVEIFGREIPPLPRKRIFSCLLRFFVIHSDLTPPCFLLSIITLS